MLTRDDKVWIVNALISTFNIVVYHFSCRDDMKDECIKRLKDSIDLGDAPAPVVDKVNGKEKRTNR